MAFEPGTIIAYAIVDSNAFTKQSGFASIDGTTTAGTYVLTLSSDNAIDDTEMVVSVAVRGAAAVNQVATFSSTSDTVKNVFIKTASSAAAVAGNFTVTIMRVP